MLGISLLQSDVFMNNFPLSSAEGVQQENLLGPMLLFTHPWPYFRACPSHFEFIIAAQGLALKCAWGNANFRARIPTQKGHARSASLSGQVSREVHSFHQRIQLSLLGTSLCKEVDPKVTTFQSTFTMFCSFLRMSFISQALISTS